MNKNILMGVIAALSIASASAETIYITGSTAFRSSANAAINGLSGMTRLASDATNYTSAGNLLFTNSGGYLVNVHWSGSEGGIQSVLNTNATFNYLPEDGSVSGDATNNANYATNPHYGNLAFSDTYQTGASIFSGTKAGDGFNYPAATMSNVGVVAFSWVASAGCTASNISAETARFLLLNGVCSEALLTGVQSDTNNRCFLVGRNVDSGTRLTTLAVTGYGVSSTVKQYAVGTNYSNATNAAGAFTGTSATNSILIWPSETINGVNSKTYGGGGYASGGTLCGLMNTVYANGGTMQIGKFTGTFPSASLGFTTNLPDGSHYSGSTYLVGYAGTSDANGKTNATSTSLIKLTYNGVAGTTNNIANGSYPFWGYEHLVKGTQTTAHSGAVFTNLFNSLTTNFTTATLSPNVSLKDMTVSRSADGGALSQKY